MSLLDRILPRQADDRFAGYRAALWLLGLYVALKLVMSVNSIFNTRSVAVGADGFDVASYGADGGRAVLMMFALTALGQLALALVSLLALVRYRALVPLMFTLLVAEHLARRAIVESYAVARADGGSTAAVINYALLALLVLGLALSLIRRKQPG